MGDLNSIILNNAKSSAANGNTDFAADSGASAPAADGAPTDATTDFAAILKTSFAYNAAEQSGKALPQQSMQTGDDSEVPKPDSAVDMDLSKQRLESRSLQGGMQVIVGGKAPSPAGVDAFAKSQGIDPRALALLTDRGGKLPVENAAITDAPEATEPDSILAPNLTFTDPEPKLEPIVLPQKMAAEPEPIAAWLSDSAIAQLISGSPAAPLAGRQTIEPYLQKPTRFSAPSQHAGSGQKPATALPEAFNLEQLAAAIKAKPVNAQQQVQPDTQIAEKLTFKTAGAKTLTENFSQLNIQQQQQPAVKLEAINLMPKAELGMAKAKTADTKIATIPTAAVAATPLPAAVVAAPTAVVINDSGLIAAAPTFDTRSEQATTDTLPEQLEQQSLRKQEEQADMSRRLAEALGQRLSAQISRGAWRVEMDLHPKSLGRIEIQLEMKNGELEANFNAASAATRELLQDSMPRLRVALEEHGMESAYIGLGLGNQAQSDGNSTAQNSSSERAGLLEDEEAESTAHAARLDDNGLDVMV